jgi:hypothetical protein
MKKITISILTLSLLSGIVKGQITEGENQLRTTKTVSADTVYGWRKGGLININFSQAQFSNWAAGGQNSLSLNSMLSSFLSYKSKNFTWDNMLDVGYGLLKQGTNGKLIKTDDKIDFTSKYGHNASKDWYYALLLNFKTQMRPGYNYPNDSVKISNFLAPAYLLGAAGMDFKPSKNFTCFIAPATIKTTIVNDQHLADAGAYGVTAATRDGNGNILTHGKMLRNELGGYIRIVYRDIFFKDSSVTLLTKLDLFSNYLHNPQNIDVNWETTIGFKVNKYISASIIVNVLYDDDIRIPVDKNKDGITDLMSPRTQVKEILGIGFSYKF